MDLGLPPPTHPSTHCRGRAATFGIERQTAIGPKFDGQVRRWDAWETPELMGFDGIIFVVI